uniref:Putative secreted peptide n=1 Tax=Anopheles braziliensis TaxID=58242 RepID=A0A2M3ZWT7_9DIPT
MDFFLMALLVASEASAAPLCFVGEPASIMPVGRLCDQRSLATRRSLERDGFFPYGTAGGIGGIRGTALLCR